MPQPIQLALFTQPDGPLVSDETWHAADLTFATDQHGPAEASYRVPLNTAAANRYYDRAGLPHLEVSGAGPRPYEGRLEDAALTQDGIRVSAYGYSRCLTDIPYNALWSTSDCTLWRPYTNAEDGAFSENLYQYSVNNGAVRLFPQRGLTYGTTGTAKAGGLAFDIPNGSSRQMVGIQFTYAARIRANWVIRLATYTLNPTTFVALPWTYTAGGAGALTNGAFCASFAACDRLVLQVFYNAADAVYNFDNGDVFVNIYPRIVTTTTNMISTTLTAGFVAGNNINAQVGSSARMYVGQRIFLGADGGAAIGFTSVIESIPDSTHFVADWPTVSPGAGTTIKAQIVYADEIVQHMLSTLNAVSGGAHLASSTAAIESPALDLFSESYADASMRDTLDHLVSLGDNQTTPRQWEWLVDIGRLLVYRPRGSSIRTWYVDATEDLEIDRTIDQLSNSVYAIYQGERNEDLRTAASTDTLSVGRFGIVRREALSTQTTSSVQATVQRDAELADKKDPIPRASLTIRRIYDAQGARWPLHAVRAGDTVVLRNLLVTSVLITDRVRVFRVNRTSYRAKDNLLTVEPESPLPSLAALLARSTLSGAVK